MDWVSCGLSAASAPAHPISSLQNPAIADIYTEHAHQVVVAKYAPSGFYIASGGMCCGPGVLALGGGEEGDSRG